jgi:hypothetical protein
MGKRRADADQRKFFDQFLCVKIARLRATGVVRLDAPHAIIQFGDRQKLIGLVHVRFRTGGSWSLFRCPRCDRRCNRLWSVDDRPLCKRCCLRMNIWDRSSMGFGRGERLRARDQHLDRLIAKLETTAPLRFNGAPASWQGKARLVYRSRRLTRRMRRSMIALRLSQLATQNASGSLPQSYTPSAATKQIIDFGPVRRARTPETLERALDQAEDIILTALQSNDPQTRLNAARLMLRSRAARQRGWE